MKQPSSSSCETDKLVASDDDNRINNIDDHKLSTNYLTTTKTTGPALAPAQHNPAAMCPNCVKNHGIKSERFIRRFRWLERLDIAIACHRATGTNIGPGSDCKFHCHFQCVETPGADRAQ